MADLREKGAIRGFKQRLVFLGRVFKAAGKQWVDHGSPSRSAALAFYSLLSIAPLITLSIAVIGLFWGDEAATGHVARELEGLVGRSAGDAINSIIESGRESDRLSSVVNIAIALFGATGVFGELQLAMNRVWNVEARPGSAILTFLRDRFFSLTMVMGVAFLLMVSLVINSTISGIMELMRHRIQFPALWSLLNSIVAFTTSWVLFSLIFKLVPDVQARWRDVWLGGMITGLFFSVGKSALGSYVASTSQVSAFGAAGSLVALILWIYYSSQVLLLGAEVSCQYAVLAGHNVAPMAHAKRVVAPAAASK